MQQYEDGHAEPEDTLNALRDVLAVGVPFIMELDDEALAQTLEQSGADLTGTYEQVATQTLSRKSKGPEAEALSDLINITIPASAGMMQNIEDAVDGQAVDLGLAAEEDFEDDFDFSEEVL